MSQASAEGADCYTLVRKVREAGGETLAEVVYYCLQHDHQEKDIKHFHEHVFAPLWLLYDKEVVQVRRACIYRLPRRNTGGSEAAAMATSMEETLAETREAREPPVAMGQYSAPTTSATEHQASQQHANSPEDEAMQIDNDADFITASENGQVRAPSPKRRKMKF